MHVKYFGDSYDIVKQSLIRWLTRFGRWSVHPMFTAAANPEDAAAFEAFLDAHLLSNAVLKTDNRSTYFDCAAKCGNLFLDPDTGLRLEPIGGARAAKFLFVSELISLVQKRPEFLTLVFDQSHPRGSERASLDRKLRHLSDHGILAFAYKSHACFIVAGHDPSLVRRAHTHLLDQSRLPESRFVLHLPSE